MEPPDQSPDGDQTAKRLSSVTAFGGSLRRTVSLILFRTRRRKKAEGEGQGRDSNRHERTTDELRKKVGQQAMLDGQRADGKPKRGRDQARGDYKTPAIFRRRTKRPIRAAAFSNGGRGKQHRQPCDNVHGRYRPQQPPVLFVSLGKWDARESCADYHKYDWNDNQQNVKKYHRST